MKSRTAALALSFCLFFAGFAAIQHGAQGQIPAISQPLLGKGIPPTFSFRTSRSNGAVGSATYSETTVDIGTADASRIVLVCITGTAVGASTFSSATIDGVSAAVAKQNTGATRGLAVLMTAAVPANHTTATISYTNSLSLVRASMGVYATYNLLSATPTTTALANTTTSGQAQSINMNVTPGALAFGCSYDNGDGGSPTPVTWAGFSSSSGDYTQSPSSDGNSGASYLSTVTSSPRTFTGTWTTSSQGSGVGAVFN